jgi:AsmA family protein
VRLLRIAAWAVVGIAALLAVATAALWFDGGPIIAWAINHPVSASMGRQIRVAGPLTIRWGSPSRIVAETVSVANAPGAKTPTMFRAKRVAIEFYPSSLFSGPTQVSRLEIDDANLQLETSPQGVGNWKFTTAAPQHREHFPVLQHFVVRNSALEWRNGRTGARTMIDVTALDLDAPNATSPVKITGEGRFQQLPVRLSATVGPLQQLRNPAKAYPVAVWSRLGGMDLAIDGTVMKPLDFSGVDFRLSLQGATLKELADALSLPLPELPQFRGTAKLRGGEGDWRLDALSLALGKSDLEGGIAIDTNAKVPEVTANLTSSYIDLADFAGAVGATPAHAPAYQPKPSPSGRIIPDTPIAIHKLPGIDARIAFYGTRIRSTSGLPLQRVTLDLGLKNGVLTLKPLRFHVASGDLDLTMSFTPWIKAGAPRLDADLAISQVDLHQLFASPTYPAPLHETRGKVGGFVRIATTGVSLRQFLARMDGDAGIFMENGQFSLLLQKIAPIDVLESLGVLLTGDQPLPINCFVSHFNIKQGVATASTFVFDTAETNVVGAGNINFDSETLYLDLKPDNKHPTPLSLRTPIEVRGTFRKPSFGVNPTGILARLGAAVGLGIAFPPAAILPLIDTGLGPQNACSRAYAHAPQSPAGTPAPLSGGSTPPR